MAPPDFAAPPAAIALLSSLDAPPAWIAWARPATPAERRALGVDVVFTLDLDEGREPGSPPAGVARVGFAVRWQGEPFDDRIATWRVDRVHPEHVSPFRRWLADVRRDLRRRGERHGQLYTEAKIHVLDPRNETHAPRRIVGPQKK